MLLSPRAGLLSAVALSFAPGPKFASRSPCVPARVDVVASASLPSWSELEAELPSAVDTSGPIVIAADAADADDLTGKTVLYRDACGYCPYSERLWLALEIKCVPFVTCLVDDEYSKAPGEAGSLPRVQWPDGTTDEDTMVILERLQREYPRPPDLFPDKSVAVGA